MIALGSKQIPGVDFYENYSPIINDKSFRIMLILFQMNNYAISSFDVETAYLNGDPNKTIYMKIPQGIMKVEGKSVKSQKILKFKVDLTIKNHHESQE